MSGLLQAIDVSFAYGAQAVLRGVSVDVQAGRITALLGPNGSGKSTLIKVLMGHLRASGQVLCDGRPVSRWPARKLARLVAYLPQFPAHEVGQTVAQVIALGRAPYLGAFGIESAEDAKVVREVAAALQLEEMLDRPVDELSGGQRQRVFIGRCLAQRPRALLLDEPTSSLDLRHQVELMRLLKDLATKDGLAILMASHDLNLAGMFADRLVLLHEGKVAAEGPADAVLRPEVLSGVYGVGMERIERGGGVPVVVPRVMP